MLKGKRKNTKLEQVLEEGEEGKEELPKPTAAKKNGEHKQAPPETLNVKDIDAVVHDKKCKKLYESCRLTPRDLRGVFHKMDPFASGEVKTTEFLKGCTRITSDVEGIDTVTVKGAARKECIDLLDFRGEV